MPSIIPVKIHNTNIKGRKILDTRCKRRVVAGLTGFTNTRRCRWRARNWVSDVMTRGCWRRNIRKNKTTRATRLHDLFGGYFLNLSWERLPRVGEHARLNPSGKNVSADTEMSARKKNTRAIGRHDARTNDSVEKSSGNNRINSPNIATGICTFCGQRIYSFYASNHIGKISRRERLSLRIIQYR